GWRAIDEFAGLCREDRRGSGKGACSGGRGLYGLSCVQTFLRQVGSGSVGRVCSGLPVGLNRRFLFNCWLDPSNGHGLLWLFVDVKLKNVGPRIMANNIQVVFPP